MALVLADTDCVIDFLKGKAPENGRVKSAFVANELGVSAVTAYELYFGEPSGTGRADLDRLLGRIDVLPVTRARAALAAERGAALAAQGMRLSVPDLLIAGTAIEAGIPLITRNVRHFSRIEGLEILEPSA